MSSYHNNSSSSEDDESTDHQHFLNQLLLFSSSPDSPSLANSRNISPALQTCSAYETDIKATVAMIFGTSSPSLSPSQTAEEPQGIKPLVMIDDTNAGATTTTTATAVFPAAPENNNNTLLVSAENQTTTAIPPPLNQTPIPTIVPSYRCIVIDALATAMATAPAQPITAAASLLGSSPSRNSLADQLQKLDSSSARFFDFMFENNEQSIGLTSLFQSNQDFGAAAAATIPLHQGPTPTTLSGRSLLERIEKERLVRDFHELCKKDFSESELEPQDVWVSRLDHHVVRNSSKSNLNNTNNNTSTCLSLSSLAREAYNSQSSLVRKSSGSFVNISNNKPFVSSGDGSGGAASNGTPPPSSRNGSKHSLFDNCGSSTGSTPSKQSTNTNNNNNQSSSSYSSPEDISYSFVIILNELTSEVVGGATVEFYHQSRSALLGYVVIGMELRGKGYLSKIVNSAVDYLREACPLHLTPGRRLEQLFIDVFQVSNNNEEVSLASPVRDDDDEDARSLASSVMIENSSSLALELSATLPAVNNSSQTGIIPFAGSTTSQDGANNNNNNNSPFKKRRRKKDVAAKHHLVFRDEFAAARQKIWGKLGFVPFQSDLMHPGEMFHGKYQVACYAPLADESWKIRNTTTTSSKQQKETENNNNNGQSDAVTRQESLLVNVPFDTLTSFITTYFHSMAISSVSSAPPAEDLTAEISNTSSSGKKRSTSPARKKREGETEIKIFLQTLVSGSSSTIELHNENSNNSPRRGLFSNAIPNAFASAENFFLRSQELRLSERELNFNSANGYQVKTGYVAPSFVSASRDFWK